MTETVRYPLERFEANSVRLEHEGRVLSGVELVLTTRLADGKATDVRFLVPADIALNLAGQITQAAQSSAQPAVQGTSQVH